MIEMANLIFNSCFMTESIIQLYSVIYLFILFLIFWFKYGLGGGGLYNLHN